VVVLLVSRRPTYRGHLSGGAAPISRSRAGRAGGPELGATNCEVHQPGSSSRAAKMPLPRQ
jgi:hypothetical protein